MEEGNYKTYSVQMIIIPKNKGNVAFFDLEGKINPHIIIIYNFISGDSYYYAFLEEDKNEKVGKVVSDIFERTGEKLKKDFIDIYYKDKKLTEDNEEDLEFLTKNDLITFGELIEKDQTLKNSKNLPLLRAFENRGKFIHFTLKYKQILNEDDDESDSKDGYLLVPNKDTTFFLNSSNIFDAGQSLQTYENITIIFAYQQGNKIQHVFIEQKKHEKIGNVIKYLYSKAEILKNKVDFYFNSKKLSENSNEDLEKLTMNKLLTFEEILLREKGIKGKLFQFLQKFGSRGKFVYFDTKNKPENDKGGKIQIFFKDSMKIPINLDIPIEINPLNMQFKNITIIFNYGEKPNEKTIIIEKGKNELVGNVVQSIYSKMEEPYSNYFIYFKNKRLSEFSVEDLETLTNGELENFEEINKKENLKSHLYNLVKLLSARGKFVYFQSKINHNSFDKDAGGPEIRLLINQSISFVPGKYLIIDPLTVCFLNITVIYECEIEGKLIKHFHELDKKETIGHVVEIIFNKIEYKEKKELYNIFFNNLNLTDKIFEDKTLEEITKNNLISFDELLLKEKGINNDLYSLSKALGAKGKFAYFEIKKKEKEKEKEKLIENKKNISNFIEKVYQNSQQVKESINTLKNIFPEKIVDVQKKLESPKLISEKEESEDEEFLLSLVAKNLKDKGVEAEVIKEDKDNFNISEILNLGDNFNYYIGNGLDDKNIYEFTFDFGETKNRIFIKKESFPHFEYLWKSIISEKLNIKIEDLIFILLEFKSEYFKINILGIDINFEISEIQKIFSDFKEIIKITKKNILGTCLLTKNCLDSRYNKNENNWSSNNKKRGGEDFISPKGWRGFGIKVIDKYDEGNNDWINNNSNNGEFAIAYYGINNLFGDSQKMIDEVKYMLINPDIAKYSIDQTFCKDNDLRHLNQKCGKGTYLFQDPNIAENTAGVINIGGVKYKILFMCRVNKKFIRQPEEFPDCWILNANPNEIRPYRILVKKIFMSALSGSSQSEIKIFPNITPTFMKIIDSKSETFKIFNKKNISISDFVINKYSGSEYKQLNDYLRNGIVSNNNYYSENEIISWAYLLNKALTSNEYNNVAENTVVYRGINSRFPDPKVGNEFFFGEFISTSRNENIARNFAGMSGTILVIKIKNNGINGTCSYCSNIKKLSEYPNEDEILITSNCKYLITNISVRDNRTYIEMICKGYQI